MRYTVSIEEYEDLLKAIDGISEKELQHIEANRYFFSHGLRSYELIDRSSYDEEPEWYWVLGETALLIGYSYQNTIHVLRKKLT